MQIQESMSQYSEMEPLWHFLDVAFDYAARNPLWLDIADFYMAAEDFCKQMTIPDDAIPECHKEMFKMREHGFMSQAKYPYYTRMKWITSHPVPLVEQLQENLDSVLYRFEDFLIGQKSKYNCVLCELYRNWLINTKQFYVIYDSAEGVPCGRAVTWSVADAICETQPHYTWDIEDDPKFASLPVRYNLDS